jgi:hypothetical protein
MQPSMPACPDRDMLNRFLLGYGKEAEALARHFAACERCVETALSFNENDTLVAGLRALRSDAMPSKAEAEAVSGLIARLHDSGPARLEASATAAAEDASSETWLRSVLAPAEATDEIGRLGPYRILRLLGQGAWGPSFMPKTPACGGRAL